MAVIVSNQPIAKDVFRMTVSGIPMGRAGQFYLLRVPGALDPLLGRPVSIFECCEETGETTFVYQKVGRGTAQFSLLLPGQTIEAQGPFGNGFSLTPGRAVVVGGGIGTAPLFQLVKELRASDPRADDRSVLGFGGGVGVSEFERFCDSVSVNVADLTDGVDFSWTPLTTPAGRNPCSARRREALSATRGSLFARKAHGLRRWRVPWLHARRRARKRVCKDGPVDYGRSGCPLILFRSPFAGYRSTTGYRRKRNLRFGREYAESWTFPASAAAQRVTLNGSAGRRRGVYEHRPVISTASVWKTRREKLVKNEAAFMRSLGPPYSATSADMRMRLPRRRAAVNEASSTFWS